MAVMLSMENVAYAENVQYRNSGVISSFELGYKYPVSAQSKVVYENLGVRKVGSLHPLELTYSIGYRFNNWVALSAGAGVSYEMVDLRRYGDKIVSDFSGSGILKDGVYSNLDIPVFLDLHVYMSSGKNQPFMSVKGGLYALNSSMLYLEGGFGWNLRLNKRCNLYLMATASMCPSIWGTVGDNPTMGRRNAFAPGIKVGFSL
jgi:hypothetical protein